jgi:hypothetical protein
MESNAMFSKMTAKGMVVKFLSIISLEENERKLELGANIGMKR